MALCWPLQMPPTAKSVLISLADNANDDGHCWPSIPTIADRTCFSERAVHRAIGWLESTGILVADRSNGRHTRYFVEPSKYSEPPQMRRPRKSGTTADAAAQPPQMRQEPPQMRQEPLPEVRSNRKEPSRTVKSNRQGSADAAEMMPELPPGLLRDYLAVRKAKRLALTPTAVAGLRREAEKAGMGFVEAITVCCERGWGGFKHEWLVEDAGRQKTNGRQASTGYQPLPGEI